MTQVQTSKPFELTMVGIVCREDESVGIEILPAFRPALKELETFSHAQVFWWFSKVDDSRSRQTTQFEKMPFAAPRLGVFACRSPLRPNPIGLTTVRILGVDPGQGWIEIADIDAYHGTPVLDIKAYLPHCDRVKEVKVPAWAAAWPDWLPEEGLGLKD